MERRRAERESIRGVLESCRRIEGERRYGVNYELYTMAREAARDAKGRGFEQEEFNASVLAYRYAMRLYFHNRSIGNENRAYSYQKEAARLVKEHGDHLNPQVVRINRAVAWVQEHISNIAGRFFDESAFLD